MAVSKAKTGRKNMIRRWAVQVWSRGAKGEVESAILVTA